MEAPLISDLEEKTEMIFSSKEEFPDLTQQLRFETGETAPTNRRPVS
jgi:hypothetical protein